MSTKDRGPVSMPLVASTVAIVFATILVCQHFGALTLGSLCRTLLLLPQILG